MKHTKGKIDYSKLKWRVAEFIRERAPNIVTVMSGTDTIVELPETNNKREYAKLIAQAPKTKERHDKMYMALKEMLIAFRLKGSINEERKQTAFLKLESLLKEIES